LKHFQKNTILPDSWTLVKILMNQIMGNCLLTKERMKEKTLRAGKKGLGRGRDTEYGLQ
jgi:hypothetical protein